MKIVFTLVIAAALAGLGYYQFVHLPAEREAVAAALQGLCLNNA